MRATIALALALAAAALPAAADRLVIDDDGHRYVPEAETPGPRIDIGDDGVSFLDPAATRAVARMGGHALAVTPPPPPCR